MPRPKRDRDLDAALELVVQLAFQNTVDRYDNPAEYRRQIEAIELVEETFKNVDSSARLSTSVL